MRGCLLLRHQGYSVPSISGHSIQACNRLTEEINRAMQNHQQVRPLLGREAQPQIKRPCSAKSRAQV